MPETRTPFNDAHLVQLVRGALGRNRQVRGSTRINVSSCKYIVTLHGHVPSAEARNELDKAVRRVDGVRGVINKLSIP